MKTSYITRTFVFLFFSVVFGVAGLGGVVSAQEQLTLTVAPPLVQINIGPGEYWASSLKIVNTNQYDLTVFALVTGIAQSGTSGQVTFTSFGTNGDGEAFGLRLSDWIQVSPEPIFVPKERSVDIPFEVRIPENAPPGGHYAAILVGTNPLVQAEGGAQISVSSVVASLLFARVAGDVYEDGRIREFQATESFYQKPDVDFLLRFENKGNTHLQPVGEITIFDMFGKEVGNIPINQNTHFGNVLPKSTRDYKYEWVGEQRFFDLGMYRAVVTVTFGEDGHQNAQSNDFFWVVPVKPLLGVVGGILAVILIVMFSIRRYIRRSLAITLRTTAPTKTALPLSASTEPDILEDDEEPRIVDLRRTKSSEEH